MSSNEQTLPQAIERLWPQVVASPELHLHQVDFVQQAGLFVRMEAGAYRSASFLDGRSFGPRTVGGWIPLERIRETVLARQAPASPLHFIFHMGHTGSTLLSRLLDETGDVQPLREPLALRTLAGLHDTRDEPASLASGREVDDLTEVQLRLWARCRDGRTRAIVKATSSAARISVTLMAARPHARAVFLSMAPEPYLAVILGGPNSLLDVRGHAEERMRRMMRMLGSPPRPLHALSPGELIAASWVTEALTREDLRRAVGERMLAVDFDSFLADIRGAMDSILAHLGIEGGPELAERIARSPALGRYAKAPEHSYSSQLRADVIRTSRAENGAEIRRGMALLETLAGDHTQVAEVLNVAG